MNNDNDHHPADSLSDCYDLVSEKLTLINHVILELPQQREPIVWVSLFIVGYGIYEKTFRSFYLEDEQDGSRAVKMRSHTRNFNNETISILRQFDSSSTRVVPAKAKRQTFAHGDFSEDDLISLNLEELVDDLNHFREAILDAQTQIAECS
jgi:hypothetical protein